MTTQQVVYVSASFWMVLKRFFCRHKYSGPFQANAGEREYYPTGKYLECKKCGLTKNYKG